MRKLACLTLALLANLTALSAAQASSLASDAETTVSWRLGFGAGPVQPGYGLTLGYRSADPDALAGQLLEIDVSHRAAFARLAGLPLFERNYQSQQDEGDALPAGSGPTPWYTRKWVMWTVGGVAATAALAGSGGGITYTHNGGQTTTGRDGCSTGNVSAGDEETPCASETVGTQCVEGEVCVFCGNNGVTGGCPEWTDRRVVAGVTVDLEHQRWLDAGTGRMGDLVARQH